MICYPDRYAGGVPVGDPRAWALVDRLIPADKSISHRILLFAALSPHPVVIANLNDGKAVSLLVDALRGLGVAIDAGDDGHAIVVHGPPRAATPPATVYLGPSSAAARLLIGVLVGLGVECVVDGDATLRQRPFDWIVEPLVEMGARITYLGQPGGLPLRIEAATFEGGAVRTRVGSAQAVSALLFAGIAARRAVTVDYPVAARDHTQVMARAFGDRVEDRDSRVSYAPGTLTLPARVRVPKDPSAAAYPAALFWLLNRDRPDAVFELSDVCLNPTRLGFFHWMRACGFRLEIVAGAAMGGEPSGRLMLRGGGAPSVAGLGDKQAFHAMIDEVPLALAVAALLPGRVVFRDLYELTFKETDRIAATQAMLAALGLRVAVAGFDVSVEGGQVPAPAARLPSFGDHRLSMTAHVVLMAHGLGAWIEEGACFDTSFPAFGRCMDMLLADVP